MGCDIHAHWEIKVKGKWLHYDQPKFGRNYRLFEKMAGVRGEVENAISPPRGLPDDINESTALCAEYAGVDGHSHSWLSSAECEELYLFHESMAKKDQAWRLSVDQWGYLFGGEWHEFHEFRACYPDFIEDFRLVFWFDN